MSKKIFVGGLNCGTSSDDLKVPFTTIDGIVEVIVMTARYTELSLGFRFVTFESEELVSATM